MSFTSGFRYTANVAYQVAAILPRMTGTILKGLCHCPFYVLQGALEGAVSGALFAYMGRELFLLPLQKREQINIRDHYFNQNQRYYPGCSLSEGGFLFPGTIRCNSMTITKALLNDFAEYIKTPDVRSALEPAEHRISLLAPALLTIGIFCRSYKYAQAGLEKLAKERQVRAPEAPRSVAITRVSVGR